MSDTPDDDEDPPVDDGLLPSEDEVDDGSESDDAAAPEPGFDFPEDREGATPPDDRPGEPEGAHDDEDVDAPLDDLVERTRADDGAADEDDVMDAFEEVEVDGVEADELWTQLEQDGVEETVDEPRSDTERDVTVIDKRDYCMRCQYFSAPPEMRCTHERAEILSMVDTDQFEVADCPIVRGEEELENLRR